MEKKPKMALLDPVGAARVANGTPLADVRALEPVPPLATQVDEPVVASAPSERSKKEPKKADANPQDRLYVYVPPGLAKAIRVHCAGERLTQSEFAQAAFERELERRGVSIT